MANVPTPCTTPAVAIIKANRGAGHQRMSGPTSTRYNVTSAPIPLAQALAGGIVGAVYSETISIINGTSPYTFAVTVGALPAGCALNTATGVISGTLSTAGTFNFTIQVTDANGLAGTQAFQVVVLAPSGGGNFAWAY